MRSLCEIQHSNRWKSQGVLARLCEFPGSAAQRFSSVSQILVDEHDLRALAAGSVVKRHRDAAHGFLAPGGIAMPRFGTWGMEMLAARVLRAGDFLDAFDRLRIAAGDDFDCGR